VSVAQPILGLEHPGLRFDARDRAALGHPEGVELGQRSLLLRRQRRERIAERAGLDADELGVRIIATDLAVHANHFPRRTFQIDELFVFLPLVVQVDEARRLEPSAVLVDDDADVVLLLRGRGNAAQPGVASSAEASGIGGRTTPREDARRRHSLPGRDARKNGDHFVRTDRNDLRTTVHATCGHGRR
jgi:hypothetical protein